ncbi:MAG: hypothetical protein RJA36_1862 [Pseudomonadota bacterium]|jgi:hypothetical protein
MAQPQLTLVTDPAPGFNAHTRDDTRRVFEHWLRMLGRSPRRCKLGPTRRAAINAAMAMGYDVETIMLAVDGIAADPLDGARNDGMREQMRELDWLLVREARIERWAALGEQFHAGLQCTAAAPDEPASAVDVEAEAAHMQRCIQRAREMRGAAHG